MIEDAYLPSLWIRDRESMATVTESDRGVRTQRIPEARESSVITAHVEDLTAHMRTEVVGGSTLSGQQQESPRSSDPSLTRRSGDLIRRQEAAV